MNLIDLELSVNCASKRISWIDGFKKTKNRLRFTLLAKRFLVTCNLYLIHTDYYTNGVIL